MYEIGVARNVGDDLAAGILQRFVPRRLDRPGEPHQMQPLAGKLSDRLAFDARGRVDRAGVKENAVGVVADFGVADGFGTAATGNVQRGQRHGFRYPQCAAVVVGRDSGLAGSRRLPHIVH